MSSRVICCEAKEHEKKNNSVHSGPGKYFYNGRYYCGVHYPIIQVHENLSKGDYSFNIQR